MALRAFLTSTCMALACCAAVLAPQQLRAGATDAVFISSGSSTAQ